MNCSCGGKITCTNVDNEENTPLLSMVYCRYCQAPVEAFRWDTQKSKICQRCADQGHPEVIGTNRGSYQPTPLVNVGSVLKKAKAGKTSQVQALLRRKPLCVVIAD